MKPGGEPSQRKGATLPNLIILILCSVILGGALISNPPTNENPYMRIGGITLPGICMFHGMTGLPCPGCGLTRSISAAAHGDLKSSFSHHRLGLLLLYYLFLQFVFNFVFIAIPRWRKSLSRPMKILHRGIIALAVLFVLNWILTLILILA